MYRAYKYRLYPTVDQQQKLNQFFAAVRWVYNAALEQRNIYGRKQGSDPFERDSSFTAPRQSKELHYKVRNGVEGLRTDEDLKWISETPKDCLDAALRDLDEAFSRFFDNLKKGIPGGYPSWRSADRNNSLSFKAFSRKIINGVSVAKPMVVFGQDCVTIPKLGRIRYKRHRKFYGDPKTVEVIREGTEYYVILVTQHKVKEVKHTGGDIAVDLGVSLPVCLSNGEHIGPDHGLEVLDAKARMAQKKLSRAKKGSIRRHKAKLHLGALKRKQARRRTARTHRITTELTRRFRFIGLEDLKVKNMTASAKGDADNPGKKVKQKSGLNRVILNVSFHKIREQIVYKAEKTGTQVVFVDPKYTSQRCNVCGHVDKENRRSQAEFNCTNCPHVDHADRNGARNVLQGAYISAGVSARRKSPSKSTVLKPAFRKPADLATIKASGSCFQPASSLKMPLVSERLRDVW